MLAAVLAAALIASCGGAEGPRPGANLKVDVIRVVDGDTILVDLDGREEYVRYIGVDTPESVKPGERPECFGLESSLFNRRQVEGRTVRLEVGEEERDRFGRLLAYVFVGNRMVNAELLRAGMAETLTIAPNDRFAKRFGGLEEGARRSSLGIWRFCE